jgi:dephospho-CoA kinase
MTKIIGLTGGIGSGKTTVAAAFEKLGVPVYIADWHAKNIMEQPETLLLLKKVFGQSIFDGAKLNKIELSKIVFENPERLRELNEIVHPLVKVDFKNWLKTKQNHKFIIKEAAILFESGTDKYCDKIILVTASMETRIDRVLKRDGISRNLLMKKIINQLSDEEKMLKSDFVIHNVNFESTMNQVDVIFGLLNNL